MARGMANNEPTVSQAATEAYRDGFDRNFGERPTREPGRRVYVYRGGRLVEQGGPDDTGFYDESDDLARNHIMSDLYMDGTTVPGPNGPIDIGSRAKRRAFMKADPVTGEPRELADMSDYEGKGGEWDRAAQRRAAIMRGEDPTGKRREAIGRALYEASKRR